MKRMRMISRMGTAILLMSAPSARCADIGGSYVIAQAADPQDHTPYQGTVEIVPRHNAYSLSWRPEGHRGLRGLALREGDVLGVSYGTGGPAYGLIIYHREGARWQGKWVTSIDSASAIGDAAIENADPLIGRHRFTGHRPGAGSFDGSVNIEPRGNGYLLTFTSGRLLLYRALGTLEGDRLVVAWGFGSSPSLAVYDIKDDTLTGRRLTIRSGVIGDGIEHLARAGSAAAPVLPVPLDALSPAPAPSNPEPIPGTDTAGEPPLPQPGAMQNSADLTAGPQTSPLMEWSYGELLGRFDQRGYAKRWMEQQLTPEERALLDAAVRRYEHSGGKKALAGKTIGDLITEERKRTDAK